MPFSSRRPAVVLVDELAHTNAPGSRHPKRYQDVEELLDSGIDVYTTVNIQHFESLNDVVEKITGIRMQETLPDTFLDRADEVQVIDIPFEELSERLKEGKVYIPKQAERAMENFFQPWQSCCPSGADAHPRSSQDGYRTFELYEGEGDFRSLAGRRKIDGMYCPESICKTASPQRVSTLRKRPMPNGMLYMFQPPP